MTVMLRSLGVPARIAVGFFPVSYDPERGGFLYRERNAHAWVEVYFPGYGWIPFEPTASQRPLDYGGSPPEPAAVATPEPAPEPTPAAAPTAVPTVTPPGTTAAPEEPADPSLLDRAPGPLGLATIALGLLVLLGAVAAVALWSWGLRGLSPAGALYSRALRVGRWLGVATDRATTPAEYADRLGRVVPAAAVPARTVADIYAREQYAAVPPDPAETRAGRDAWRQLRAALARSLLRRRRGGDLG
jgi:transglutaminase-like putative cysteine protease